MTPDRRFQQLCGRLAAYRIVAESAVENAPQTTSDLRKTITDGRNSYLRAKSRSTAVLTLSEFSKGFDEAFTETIDDLLKTLESRHLAG